MSLNDSLQEKKFDVRLVRHNTQKGVINDDDLKKYRQALPDDAVNAESVRVFDVSVADDDVH
jgi:hypothetical protein